VNTVIQPLPGKSQTPHITTALTVLAAAIAPVLVAIALFYSVARHRPLLSRYLEPRLHDGGGPATSRLATRLTVAWGVGLLLVGAFQAAFSSFANLSLLNPLDILIRTAGALALEAMLLAGTAVYLRGRR
jgi:hypothetical protein